MKNNDLLRRPPAFRAARLAAGLLLAGITLGLLPACTSTAPATGPERQPSAATSTAALKTGEQVYRETCAACHATGVAQAPRFSSREDWAPLVEEGQHVLTAHGWVGVRAMPPRGGNPALSLEEFARATAYMARSAGASWNDPDAALLERIRHEERERIEDLRRKKD